MSESMIPVVKKFWLPITTSAVDGLKFGLLRVNGYPPRLLPLSSRPEALSKKDLRVLSFLLFEALQFEVHVESDIGNVNWVQNLDWVTILTSYDVYRANCPIEIKIVILSAIDLLLSQSRVGATYSKEELLGEPDEVLDNTERVDGSEGATSEALTEGSQESSCEGAESLSGTP